MHIKSPTRFIQTTVPANWIPLLPVGDRNSVALQCAAMLDSEQKAIEPVGRILLPLHADPYKLREEEVPRTGLRVTRQFCRTRWNDGSTHLWGARRKGPGEGEGSSGLRFDIADEGK